MPRSTAFLAPIAAAPFSSSSSSSFLPAQPPRHHRFRHSNPNHLRLIYPSSGGTARASACAVPPETASHQQPHHRHSCTPIEEAAEEPQSQQSQSQQSSLATNPSPSLSTVVSHARTHLPTMLRFLPLLPLLRAAPALASVAVGGGAVAPALSLDPASFVSALTASFVLVLASEIGDKTFFICALLSVKYSRAPVLLGTMLALAAMTIVSVAIGQLFHTLPTSLKLSIPLDDYAAVAALVWFGVASIRDALAMPPSSAEELQDAKDVVAGKAAGVRGARVVAETTGLIFLAEWGDKSMLATVALAAAKSPVGVIVGGISGHFVASVIAVVGGSFLGKFVSERTARLIGGVLFLVFAVLTVVGIYYPS